MVRLNDWRARLWIGFVAVAVVAVFVLGAWVYRRWEGSSAVGPSHDDVVDTAHSDERAQEQARELVAKSYEAALRSPHRLEWEPEEVTRGEQFEEPVGMLMGHRGVRAVNMNPCGAGFGCAGATIDVGRGTTRGMFCNVSEQVAHNVTIRAGQVAARHPLSVQPGESTAFELPAELSPAELATLNITATFVEHADPRRAVLLMGAPGDITGPRDELATSFHGIDLQRDPPVITYFSEALMLENSTTHPSAAQSLPGQVLDSPTAVVALLDENQKVIQVLRPPVTSDKHSAKHMPITTMAFVETYAIGFVVPPGVAQHSISVGGAE